MSRAELRWVLVASLAVLLLASLPTLYAWSLADAEHIFSGFVYNTEDGNSYLAKMRLGARGEWLFHLPFTTEPHPGAFLYTFHLLLGKVAASLGLSFPLAYHLARILLGLGLLVTIYLFIARFVTDTTTRRLAWLLVAIGSGLGWLLTLLGATHWLGDLPLDFWVPEAYVFLVLYSLPHLALAETALLWALLLLLDALAGRGIHRAVLAGLSALVMAILVPFYPLVLGAILGVYLLFLGLRQRRIPWREIGLAALMGLFTLPVVIYNLWLTSSQPIYHTWANQLQIRSPHPLHYLLGYLPLLIPAVWGMGAFLRQRHRAGEVAAHEGSWLLPLAWLAVAPIIVYLPFVSQRRLIVLVQVPLAMLAALGLQTWFKERRWPAVAYVAFSSLSVLLLVAGSLGPIRLRRTPIYRPAAEIAALDWLAAHAATGQAVLASFVVGNVVPVHTDLTAFAGHGPETIRSVEKQAMIRRFFQPETGDAWRQALLKEYRLDYLFYGPEERALGTWDPAQAPYLSPVYTHADYVIFAVSPEGRGS